MEFDRTQRQQYHGKLVQKKSKNSKGVQHDGANSGDGSRSSFDYAQCERQIISASPMLDRSDAKNYSAHMNSGAIAAGSARKATNSTNAASNTLNDTNASSTAKDQNYQISDNAVNALFEKYKDEHEDAILLEGIERLCDDLNYKPDDFAILVLAWRLDASQMCRFTKSEFIQGLHALNADTNDGIRNRLQQIIEILKVNSEMFKQLYRFTFRFGLEPDNRIVLLDMAIILWRLVFTVHTPDILDRWLNYLELHTNIRGVPKDTWNMFLNFAETCDITAYDDTEAWPSLFDDFVEYENDRLNQNLTSIDQTVDHVKKDATQITTVDCVTASQHL